MKFILQTDHPVPKNVDRVLFCKLVRMMGLMLIFLASAPLAAQGVLNWQLLLPINADAVCFNPGSHGQIVYTATDDSIGLFKSYNGGLTWKHIFGGPSPISQGTSAISDIYVSSIDTSLLFVTSRISGVHRSTDGGYTWAWTLPDVSVQGQALVQTPDGTFYCGTSGAGLLYRSRDQGVTWDTVSRLPLGRSVCTIVAAPGDNQTLLAGSGGGAINKSIDGGKTWETTHKGDTVTTDADVPNIVYDPIHTNRIYATLYNYPIKNMLRSLDGGETWDTLSPPHNTWACEVDPQNPQRVWLGRFSAFNYTSPHFLYSEDFGNTWQDGGLNTKVTDIWALRYDTTTHMLFAATSGGVYATLISAFRGVQDKKNIDVFEVYPSVANRAIYFHSDRPRSLTIFDENGKKCWSGRISNGYPIDVSTWQSGSYFVVPLSSSSQILSSYRFQIVH